jgi:hypothetical protein
MPKKSTKKKTSHKKMSESDYKKMESEIRSEYAGKGYSEERIDKIVYGHKRKMGWKPSRERKHKRKK